MTSSPHPHKKGAVLVFGESVNDSQSIRHLLIGANASLAGRVRSLRRPVSLTRDSKPNAVRDWVDELRRTVHAFEANDGRVAAVIVHRDADGHDPEGAVAAELARQLATLDGHPVVPVQAIESWWFLFPDAVEAVRPCAWKGKLSRQPRNVELIDRPKKALQQATRGGRAPEYAESDSPVIADYIRKWSLTPLCPCKSYDRMVTLARTIV
ncbi:MAG: hypothetical protein ACRDSR_02360 [Pseudonocardiaceae bacterium]